MFGDMTKKRAALLYEAIEEVLSMLERAERMYAIACSSLLSEQDAATDIDHEDEAMNAGESKVRRKSLSSSSRSRFSRSSLLSALLVRSPRTLGRLAAASAASPALISISSRCSPPGSGRFLCSTFAAVLLLKNR